MEQNGTETAAPEIFIYKKVPRDETRVLYINVVSADATAWVKLRKEYYTKHQIVSEHVSSQYIATANPDYIQMEKMGLKRGHIPQVLQTVIVTSVFEFHTTEPGKFLH